MLSVRPTSTSDACHVKAVTFGYEFPLIRPQSVIRLTLGRKPFVLPSASIALLQLLHYRSEYERTKSISHSFSVRRGLGGPTSLSDELVVHNTVLFQKPMDTTRDLAIVGLQGKMPRIEHVGLKILQIAAVGRSTRSREDKVILAPDNQRGWLELAEEFLKGRIERHIGAVVIKQIELNLVVAGAIQAKLVQRPSRGVQKTSVLHTIFILPPRRLRGNQESNSFPILRSRILPVFLNRIPELQKTLIVCVAVLNDERLNAFGVTESKTIPDGRPIVHHIHRVLLQSEIFNKTVDGRHQILKSVRILFVIEHGRQSKAGEIGRNNTEGAGEPRNKITEHVRGRRKSMQKEKDRCILRACIAIEDVQIVDFCS